MKHLSLIQVGWNWAISLGSEWSLKIFFSGKILLLSSLCITFCISSWEGRYRHIIRVWFYHPYIQKKEPNIFQWMRYEAWWDPYRTLVVNGLWAVVLYMVLGCGVWSESFGFLINDTLPFEELGLAVSSQIVKWKTHFRRWPAPNTLTLVFNHLS